MKEIIEFADAITYRDQGDEVWHGDKCYILRRSYEPHCYVKVGRDVIFHSTSTWRANRFAAAIELGLFDV